MNNIQIPSEKQEPLKKKGLFSIGGGKKKEEPTGPKVADFIDQLSSVSRRLVTLEERHTNLDRKIQVTGNNMLGENKRIHEELRLINSDILELKRGLNELTEKVSLIIDELKTSASKEEFEVLKKYIEYWEPLNFVTRNEVEKLIDEKIKK